MLDLLIGRNETQMANRTSKFKLSESRGGGANSPFTLIELLVVIAIISILMTILLPALNVAKKRSKAIKCLGNLKQMMVASYSYTGDFNGYMFSPLTGTSTAWGLLLKEQGYINNYASIKCPTMDVNKSPTYSTRSYSLTSYHINSSTIPGYYVDKHFAWWAYGPGTHIPLSRLSSPVEQPIFVDSVAIDGSCEGYQNYYLNIDFTATHCRHFHKANIAYGDGSARPTTAIQLKSDLDNIYGTRTILIDDNFNRDNR